MSRPDKPLFFGSLSAVILVGELHIKEHRSFDFDTYSFMCY